MNRHLYKSALLGLLACLLLPLAAQAKERILAFDSHILVNRDGTLEVRETIRVKAEGENIRRGIYRDFPTTLPGAGWAHHRRRVRVRGRDARRQR